MENEVYLNIQWELDFRVRFINFWLRYWCDLRKDKASRIFFNHNQRLIKNDFTPIIDLLYFICCHFSCNRHVVNATRPVDEF